MSNVEDRVLLLLSIKEKGLWIDFDHIAQRVIRDAHGGVGQGEVNEALDLLTHQQLVSRREGKYAITPAGMEQVADLLKSGGSELNLSYRRVFAAKRYYPQVAEAMLPFLKNRAVSVVKVFSDPQDPNGRIKTLFTRYSRYKPRPVPIKIDDREALLRYVDDHALDFIPYVHSFGGKAPDWLVLDLDPGPGFRERFDLTLLVADKVAAVLESGGIHPCIKYSGSRGIQVWASLDNDRLPSVPDKFAWYRDLVGLIQKKTEKLLEREAFKDIVPQGSPITTSTVAKKEARKNQVLIDWSSMKPSGDVRAPFSIHYKTGLVSCPIPRDHVLDFETDEAKDEVVAGRVGKLEEAFRLEKADPTELIRMLR